MNTIEKGNKLEDEFYNYLCDQQNRGDFIYGAHAPQRCKIYKKKKYFSKTRDDDVEFDVVIEVYCQGSSKPHMYVVFECKNHKNSIPELYVNDFSIKLNEVFQCASKGVMVISSRLQRGAESTARNRNIGIVKFNKHGLDIIAERKGGIRAESGFVKSQILSEEGNVKSLKFSAYHDGTFFASVDQFLGSLEPNLSADAKHASDKVGKSAPFVSNEQIQQAAQDILRQIGYVSGVVDLEKICSALSIDLTFAEQAVHDADDNPILGSANFDNKSIQIFAHDNKHRERFTIGHEIGHFCLRHDRYLRSETVAESDLSTDSRTDHLFNYERLECQANIFASELLLPAQKLVERIEECRKLLDIRDKGHGHIFVDDQPCNCGPYGILLSDLSSYFEVSMQVIEIKLTKMNMLNDQRRTKLW